MRLIDADALREMFPEDYDHPLHHFTGIWAAIGVCPTIDAEWELFQRITDAYYAKQMFFLQDDGSVYDREQAVYHSSTDAAIDAFIRRVSDA